MGHYEQCAKSFRVGSVRRTVSTPSRTKPTRRAATLSGGLCPNQHGLKKNAIQTPDVPESSLLHEVAEPAR